MDEFTWLLVLSGLVVIPVSYISEQDHVGSGLIGTDRIGGMSGVIPAEPGGILFGPY